MENFISNKLIHEQWLFKASLKNDNEIKDKFIQRLPGGCREYAVFLNSMCNVSDKEQVKPACKFESYVEGLCTSCHVAYIVRGSHAQHTRQLIKDREVAG